MRIKKNEKPDDRGIGLHGEPKPSSNSESGGERQEHQLNKEKSNEKVQSSQNISKNYPINKNSEA